MKTIEELYNEVMASEELKKEFCALKPEQIADFAEKHGCKTTLAEIRDFLTKKSTEPGELSDDEIEQAAGGKSVSFDEAVHSFHTFGVGCIVDAIDSAMNGNCGTGIETEGMLCDTINYN